MGGADSAKKADSTPKFFFDIGGLGLSGTGEGGGGKGHGVDLGGIHTGGTKVAYQPKGFTGKGLEDKKWATSNAKVGTQFQKKHPGADMSKLYAGDLGSQGGLSLSGTGDSGYTKGDFIPMGGKPKGDPKPAVVGSKGNTRVAGGKKKEPDEPWMVLFKKPSASKKAPVAKGGNHKPPVNLRPPEGPVKV